MIAVASSSVPALDAASSHISPTNEPSSNTQSVTQTPPRLLLRLPQRPEIDGRRHPLKRKWRHIVNFFALPIRSYYLEPPGLAYRQELRARRGYAWDDGDENHSFYPCPAYTDQVRDDEMVLFKAQQEAEALAAMQRDQQAATAATAAADAADAVQSGQEEHVLSPSDTEYHEGHLDEEEDDEQVGPPHTGPEATSMPAFQPLVSGPSPRYEISVPLSTPSTPAQLFAPSQHPHMRIRTRTSSNLTRAEQPSFTNGIAMSRHLSSPLSPTVFSSSPPSSSLLTRRNRAQTAATRPSLAGRNISEPLSWTLVRSQYEYPKRGLTPEQLAFLSSVESLGRFGVGVSPAPSPAYETATRGGGGGGDYGFPLTPGRQA